MYTAIKPTIDEIVGINPADGPEENTLLPMAFREGSPMLRPWRGPV